MSVSANPAPFTRALVSSGSCSLLPSQTMLSFSRCLITDCHTVSHNCRPCLPCQILSSQGQRPCLSGLSHPLGAWPRAGRAGPWSESVFQAQFSSRLSQPLGTTFLAFVLFTGQTRPPCTSSPQGDPGQGQRNEGDLGGETVLWLSPGPDMVSFWDPRHIPVPFPPLARFL